MLRMYVTPDGGHEKQFDEGCCDILTGTSW